MQSQSARDWDPSLRTLTIVGYTAFVLAVGAVLGGVFMKTLNGDYNQKETKQLMQHYGALDLSQARTSGGLVFGR